MSTPSTEDSKPRRAKSARSPSPGSSPGAPRKKKVPSRTKRGTAKSPPIEAIPVAEADVEAEAVAEPVAKRVPAKAPAKKLRFKCARCNVVLTVPMSKAGKYLDCPKCSERTPVPSTQEEADADMIDYGVKSMAYEIPAVCTHCKTKMKKGAVVCVKCGFNYKTGKQLEKTDHTLGSDEKARGTRAFIGFLLNVWGFIGSCIGSVVLVSGESAFYLIGSAFGGIMTTAILGYKYCDLWLIYRKIPIRDKDTKAEEDREERDDAKNPFGGWTPVIPLVCAGLGIGIAYLMWGFRIPEPGSQSLAAAMKEVAADVEKMKLPDGASIAGPFVQGNVKNALQKKVQRQPSSKPPRMPKGFAIRYGINPTATDFDYDGFASLVNVSGKDRPIMLTALHAFGPVNGMPSQLTPSELSSEVTRLFTEDRYSLDELGDVDVEFIPIMNAAPVDKNSEAGDIAAFWLPKSHMKHAAPLAKEAPKEGDRVWFAAPVWGDDSFDNDLEPAICLGGDDRGNLVYEFDNSELTLTETSGLPVINQKGEIVGVQVAGWKNGNRLVGVANSVKRFRPFLDKAIDK
ncbi:hypothetical protein Pan216_17900 [Planctomycetes bacterium Pan216]|uniref:Uncharacterized protein n=1 Tax=Kolteria novifilia TaxID=2527975 RepID=A0A518B1S4_9BACT|nr:hypothetical protein Pan216_17900 [Planctomycetes bacterium Pan216]